MRSPVSLRKKSVVGDACCETRRASCLRKRPSEPIFPRALPLLLSFLSCMHHHLFSSAPVCWSEHGLFAASPLCSTQLHLFWAWRCLVRCWFFSLSLLCLNLQRGHVVGSACCETRRASCLRQHPSEPIFPRAHYASSFFPFVYAPPSLFLGACELE